MRLCDFQNMEAESIEELMAFELRSNRVEAAKLIAQCLEPDREKRLQTMDEVLSSQFFAAAEDSVFAEKARHLQSQLDVIESNVTAVEERQKQEYDAAWKAHLDSGGSDLLSAFHPQLRIHRLHELCLWT